jgi:hypothetical protein
MEKPPMPREKVFFDAHIYSSAANGQLDVARWRKALHTRMSACVLTPITLLELLEWLVTPGDDAKFKTAQDALRLAWELGGKNVLDFPGSFARAKVFGERGAPAKFTRADFRKWHWVAIKARTRDELLSGRVSWPSSATRKKTFGLSAKIIHDNLHAGRRFYVDGISNYLSQIKPNWKELRKRGVKNLLSRAEQRGIDTVLEGEALKVGFVRGLLKTVGLSDARAQEPNLVGVAIRRLDAAFTHRKFILRQALTTAYNFEQDASSFHDLQLLFYLADPAYLLVTEDASLKHAVARSSQAARILGFQEFTASVGQP